MHRGSLYSRGHLMISKATEALRARDWTLNQIDPDGLRYLATISVWGHWIIAAVGLIELVYRPYYGVAKYAAYSLLWLILVGSIGSLHYRLLSNRTINLALAPGSLHVGCRRGLGPRGIERRL